MAPEIDRKELEEFIDAIPEIPVIVRENIKEDARIKAFDLKKRMSVSYTHLDVYKRQLYCIVS